MLQRHKQKNAREGIRTPGRTNRQDILLTHKCRTYLKSCAFDQTSLPSHLPSIKKEIKTLFKDCYLSNLHLIQTEKGLETLMQIIAVISNRPFMSVSYTHTYFPDILIKKSSEKLICWFLCPSGSKTCF